MKKLVMILGLASLFASGSALANGSGNVNFRGAVVAPTCEVLDSSKNQYVHLSDVQSNELFNGNTSSAKQAFRIELRNCPTVGNMVSTGSVAAKRNSKISLHFHANHDKLMDNTALKNTAKGSAAAENVGIQILNEGGSTPINFSEAPKKQGVATKEMAKVGPNGELTFNFQARYVGKGTNIVPGDVAATVPFVVTYE